MNFYDETKMLFKAKFGTEVLECVSWGNHDLNRNLVYKVSLANESFIIKIFLKPNKAIREKNVVSLLTPFNHLKIIDQGMFDSGQEWIIYNYVEGWVLEHIIDDLDLDQLRNLFYQLGHTLAKIHTVQGYDYFGDWHDENHCGLDQYKTFMIQDTERLIQNLYKADLPNKEVLDPCVQIVRAEYPSIRTLNCGRLCHRDLDGRNIIVGFEHSLDLRIKSIIDFEKTIVFNEYFDIVGLYKKYFIKEPKLMTWFFKGYEDILAIGDDFNQELKFNLFRLGIDISSWSYDFSKSYYEETIAYLKELLKLENHLEDYFKPKR